MGMLITDKWGLWSIAVYTCRHNNTRWVCRGWKRKKLILGSITLRLLSVNDDRRGKQHSKEEQLAVGNVISGHGKKWTIPQRFSFVLGDLFSGSKPYFGRWGQTEQTFLQLEDLSGYKAALQLLANMEAVKEDARGEFTLEMTPLRASLFSATQQPSSDCSGGTQGKSPQPAQEGSLPW